MRRDKNGRFVSNQRMCTTGMTIKGQESPVCMEDLESAYKTNVSSIGDLENSLTLNNLVDLREVRAREAVKNAVEKYNDYLDREEFYCGFDRKDVDIAWKLKKLSEDSDIPEEQKANIAKEYKRQAYWTQINRTKWYKDYMLFLAMLKERSINHYLDVVKSIDQEAYDDDIRSIQEENMYVGAWTEENYATEDMLHTIDNMDKEQLIMLIDNRDMITDKVKEKTGLFIWIAQIRLLEIYRGEQAVLDYKIRCYYKRNKLFNNWLDKVMPVNRSQYASHESQLEEWMSQPDSIKNAFNARLSELTENQAKLCKMLDESARIKKAIDELEDLLINANIRRKERDKKAWEERTACDPEDANVGPYELCTNWLSEDELIEAIDRRSMNV